MVDRLRQRWSRLVFPAQARQVLENIVREQVGAAGAAIAAELGAEMHRTSESLRAELRQHGGTLRRDIEREIVNSRVTLVDALLKAVGVAGRAGERTPPSPESRSHEPSAAMREHINIIREHVHDAVAVELSNINNQIQELNTQSPALKRELHLEILQHVDECRQELIRHQLTTRLLLTHTIWNAAPPQADAGPLELLPLEFNAAVDQMKSLYPHLYPVWQRINFDENPREFATRPEGSCSIGKRASDEPFGGFVAPYLNGRVLDVGCGPYAVPLYLHQYPTDLIYGIDPVEPFETHPFKFVRGFAEFLPFPNRSFDVVIAATSLDHALSLDRALASIRRVLKPDGLLLVWDGFVKGSPRYNPDDQSLQPVDEFHFFHFDEGWFEEIMSEHGFEVREKLAYDPSAHNPQYCTSYFYCLKAGASSVGPGERDVA
jgi:SAM-dependent methyltransferase